MFSITRGKNQRREERDPISMPVPILCTDQEGRETVQHAQLVDISLSGARLSIPQKIPARSAVTFYCHKFGIGGRGTVRFCRPGKKGYDVGLEFPNGTGWTKAVREKVDLLNLAIQINRETPVPQESPVELVVPSDTP
jgi:hypothetical protein